MRCLTDKTAALKKALGEFPAVYLEGSAASGKSTALWLLAEQCPQEEWNWVDVGAFLRTGAGSAGEELSGLIGSLIRPCSREDRQRPCRMIFENLPADIPEPLAVLLAELARNLPEGWRAIFVSREQPPKAFLDLIWKRRMAVIPQRELLLTREEVQTMVIRAGSLLDPEELYEVTGGWAGCVDLMIRMADRADSRRTPEQIRTCIKEETIISAGELRNRYEITAYIENEILHTLPQREQEVMGLAVRCPWISEALCEEAGGIQKARESLSALERKGLLIRKEEAQHWEAAPLFRPPRCRAAAGEGSPFSETEGSDAADAVERWYEAHGFLREALWCCRQFRGREAWCGCVIRHFEKIPFLGVPYTEISESKDHSPRVAYLRGMYYRSQGNFREMSREAESIRRSEPEIYLNLQFANPELSLKEWLDLAADLARRQAEAGGREKFRLYEILGSSYTCLCGLRDLSGLFACSKKEENRMAQIWRSIFGEAEWRAYCLARISFYLQTERAKLLCEEDRELIGEILKPAFLRKIAVSEQDPADGEPASGQAWKEGLAGLYIHCFLQALQPEEERRQQILKLADALRRSGHPLCLRNTEAVMGVFAYILKDQERLGKWLLAGEACRPDTELTLAEFIFRCRGYLLLRQYGKAAAMLRSIIPEMKKYHMISLSAEALFQQAVACWCLEQKGQTLQYVIESFLMNGACRYVTFYTIYGKPGVEVLNTYIEWMQTNMTGSRTRKKKYNYGNVLRMPEEDYIGLILRKAKHYARQESSPGLPARKETLTMMETIVLQAICQGLSNAEISEQQNLKITTVKSHIYSMYKKLGVKNRMQAALKGKELGIV